MQPYEFDADELLSIFPFTGAIDIVTNKDAVVVSGE